MANLINLSGLFFQKLFRIPDYQRGYAWEKKQLEDFWKDLMNLRPEKHHYTGMITLKVMDKDEIPKLKEDVWLVKDDSAKPYYVVDGQQRLTTITILVSTLLAFVENLAQNKGKDLRDIPFGTSENLEIIRSKYVMQTPNSAVKVHTFLFGYESDDPSAEYLKNKILGYGGTGRECVETLYTRNLRVAKVFSPTT
jgi:hypothetical protein